MIGVLLITEHNTQKFTQGAPIKQLSKNALKPHARHRFE